jgi:hypothetical protein
MPETDIDKIISELGNSINSVNQSDLDFFKEIQKKSKDTETLEDKENRGIIEMRKLWSNWILFFIGLIVVFDVLLVILYGFKVWSFEDSKVVIVVITENFLKIISLGFLITNSIFHKIF